MFWTPWSRVSKVLILNIQNLAISLKKYHKIRDGIFKRS